MAPSLEMRTSPDGSCMSLSMPRGPREVRTHAASACQTKRESRSRWIGPFQIHPRFHRRQSLTLAATILLIRTSFPLERSCSVSPCSIGMVVMAGGGNDGPPGRRRPPGPVNGPVTSPPPGPPPPTTTCSTSRGGGRAHCASWLDETSYPS